MMDPDEPEPDIASRRMAFASKVIPVVVSAAVVATRPTPSVSPWLAAPSERLRTIVYAAPPEGLLAVPDVGAPRTSFRWRPRVTGVVNAVPTTRSEEHTSELQSRGLISYAV